MLSRCLLTANLGRAAPATVVSLRADRNEVGELSKYRDSDVQIRAPGRTDARTGRNGPEPCAEVLRRTAEIHAEPAPGAGLCRRRATPADERSEFETRRRPSRVHEFAQSGDPPGEVWQQSG